MKTMQVLGVAGLALMLLDAGTARADLLTVAPAQASLVASEGLPVQVALKFDLSGLRSGEGRRIDMAFLEWTIADLPDDQEADFAAHPVTEAWSSGLVAGTVSVSVVEEPSDTWEITPADQEGGSGGFVRLDVTDLVAGWATGGIANHGVVVVTSAAEPEALSAQLGGARLVVYYGFGE